MQFVPWLFVPRRGRPFRSDASRLNLAELQLLAGDPDLLQFPVDLPRHAFGQVHQAMVVENLYAPDMPDPELMVRTSGEYRTSNFLLWQLAYSELVFTEVLWPDFRSEDLYEAVREYQRRARRFGGIEPVQ